MTPQPQEVLNSLPTEHLAALAKGQVFINAQARAQGVPADARTEANTKMLMQAVQEQPA